MTLTFALALLVASAIALPHLLPLERARPAVAATIWLSALALRALTVVFMAIFVIFFVRASDVFGLITHWCWHAVIPFIATHLALNGHSIGDAATVVPALVMAASIVSVAVGLRRAARSVGRLLRREIVGRGPAGSVIVGGSDVMLAATGVARPRILVSAGALTTLDDAELAAGLDHERGHIARHHSAVRLCAELFRALARFVPGSRTAVEELRFHLERDADEWAIRRCNDRLALASAICKAAGVPQAVAPVAASLGGQASTRRVRQLLGDAPAPKRQVVPTAVAAVMLSLALALAAMVPSAAAGGVDRLRADKSDHTCAH